jgi:hypothetical protein
MQAEQEAAQQAIKDYQQIEEGLQAIIDATEDLTAAQKLQRKIAALPVDFPPEQRAKLEALGQQARSAEIFQENAKQKLPKQDAPPRAGGLFNQGANIGVDAEGNPIADVTKMQSATIGLKQAIGEVKVLGAEMFGDFARGIGQMVSDWVLLGETGPDALRKMTAQILASAAQESAVLAIIETAKGFAALFLNPGEAAAHFTAAALFASVAGATAIAGRAIAGNAFKQNQGGAESAPSRDVTSEGYGGNRFSRDTYASGNGNPKAVEFLLQQINNKLQPVNGDTLVVGAIKRNPQAVGSAAVQSINQNDQLSRRLGQRIAA